MPTMIVLVNLKEGVSPQEYERFIAESYAPAVRALPSVEDFRDYRVSGQLASETAPPCHYVVISEVSDLEQLGQDMAGVEMQRLFSELHRLADLIQLLSERFA